MVAVVTSFVRSLSLPSSIVVVMTVLRGKPNFASPACCVSIRSVQACWRRRRRRRGRLGRHWTRGTLGEVAVPSVDFDPGRLCGSQAFGPGGRSVTVVMCRASRPNSCFRSPVSVSVMVSAITSPCGLAAFGSGAALQRGSGRLGRPASGRHHHEVFRRVVKQHASLQVALGDHGDARELETLTNTLHVCCVLGRLGAIDVFRADFDVRGWSRGGRGAFSAGLAANRRLFLRVSASERSSGPTPTTPLRARSQRRRACWMTCDSSRLQRDIQVEIGSPGVIGAASSAAGATSAGRVCL